MGTIHELIAAEKGRHTQYSTLKTETLKVFGNPGHYIVGSSVTDTFFDSDDASKFNKTETKKMVTTVPKRLNYFLAEAFTPYMDALLQKEASNQEATADVVVRGQKILEDVPALGLIAMSRMVAEVREVVEKAPVREAGPVWTWDEGDSAWRTEEPEVSYITKKVIVPFIMAPATDKFPAQIKELTEDKKVAVRKKVTWNGGLTSEEKAELLERLDELAIAVKQAEKRANQSDASKRRDAEKLAEFILGDLGA